MCNNISGIESVDALNVDYCTCFKIFQMGPKDKHKTRGLSDQHCLENKRDKRKWKEKPICSNRPKPLIISVLSPPQPLFFFFFFFEKVLHSHFVCFLFPFYFSPSNKTTQYYNMSWIEQTKIQNLWCTICQTYYIFWDELSLHIGSIKYMACVIENIKYTFLWTNKTYGLCHVQLAISSVDNKQIYY